MSAEVIVRARFVGFHAWPAAPEHRSYLGQTHRHEFHVAVAAHVWHDDRAIEFHDLKDAVRAILPANNSHLGPMSCEMIANTILADLSDQFPTLAWCEVWEDGEVGARVTVEDEP